MEPASRFFLLQKRNTNTESTPTPLPHDYLPECHAAKHDRRPHIGAKHRRRNVQCDNGQLRFSDAHLAESHATGLRLLPVDAGRGVRQFGKGIKGIWWI